MRIVWFIRGNLREKEREKKPSGMGRMGDKCGEDPGTYLNSVNLLPGPFSSSCTQPNRAQTHMLTVFLLYSFSRPRSHGLVLVLIRKKLPSEFTRGGGGRGREGERPFFLTEGKSWGQVGTGKPCIPQPLQAPGFHEEFLSQL